MQYDLLNNVVIHVPEVRLISWQAAVHNSHLYSWSLLLMRTQVFMVLKFHIFFINDTVVWWVSFNISKNSVASIFS